MLNKQRKENKANEINEINGKNERKRTFHFFWIVVFSMLWFGGIICHNTYASVFGWNLGSTTTAGKNNDTNSDYHVRLPQPFVDDLTSDQSTSKVILTEDQKHQALVWNLSNEQEQRYALLMQNKSGAYFKNGSLTPVEILGINARTDEERAQYASLDATQEFEKNAKILAFNHAYDQAAVALKDKLHLPIIRPFDYSQYSPYNYQPIQLVSNDKLMLFLTKGDNVKPIVAYLMTAIEHDPSLQLNVYFMGDQTTRGDIAEWAQSQNIPSRMVNKKMITLNNDQGQYTSLSLSNKKSDKKTPLLVLVREGQSRVVDTGRF